MTVAEPVWSPAAAAIFYGSVSILIMFVNKIVLSSYHFPSFTFLAISQGVSTIILMHFFRFMNWISFPLPSAPLFKAAMPVPVLWTLNNLTGLGGTKQLSLPMFVVLRRFSILMTMVGELWFLSKFPSRSVVASVALMIGGAVLAALSDLQFDAFGYTYVLLNDFFTAASGISVAAKLISKQAGVFGLLYINTVFSVGALTLYMLVLRPSEVMKVVNFPLWTSPPFLASYLGSCMLGYAINYGVFVCTKANSPLTTTVIGCLKNVVTTYAGMFVGGDYVHNGWNFMGLTISMVGSIYYSMVTFLSPKAVAQAVSGKGADSSAPVTTVATKRSGAAQWDSEDGGRTFSDRGSSEKQMV